MTVADLIRELQRMPPHRRVEVVTSGYMTVNGDSSVWMPLSLWDATEADEVRDEGQFVLIQGL